MRVSLPFRPMTTAEAHTLAAENSALDPEAVDRLAEQGEFYNAGSGILVVQPSHDPILDAEELYLPFVSAEVVDDQPLFLKVLSRLASLFTVERIHARLPCSATWKMEKAGPHKVAEYFLKRQAGLADRSAVLQAPLGVEIRPVETMSAQFVQALLVQAILAGYRTVEPAGQGSSGSWLGRAEDFVRDNYAFGAGDGTHALVAWRDGQPVAHVTWTDMAVDPVSGYQVVDVVDVSAATWAQGLGVGRALIGALEAIVLPHGYYLRGNVIPEPDGSHIKIIATLLTTGWEEGFTTWLYTRQYLDGGGRHGLDA